MASEFRLSCSSGDGTKMHSLIAVLLLLLYPIPILPVTSFPAVSFPSPPRQILFTSHSPNPWPRSTSRWSLHNHLLSANSISHGTNSTTPIPASATPAEICESSPTLSSIWGSLDTCEGNGHRFARTLLILVWLTILFYILGTTASDYFSCTLEKLSSAWRLSPSVAGVTLLAIGNGAPDVFSSIAAFISSDSAGSIGLASILGGALFITTVVSGTVALVTETVVNAKITSTKVNLVNFQRDALFLLASAGVLTIMLLDGKIHLWEAISFFCIYAVYAVFVWASEMLDNRQTETSGILDPLLSQDLVDSPITLKSPSEGLRHHLHVHTEDVEAELDHMLEWRAENSVCTKSRNFFIFFFKYGIEWPLAIPRRLTIPVVEEERWSRPLAVASCTLAPPFVGMIWIIQNSASTEFTYIVLGLSGGLGMVLGMLAFLSTESTKPPRRFLWLWLAGGFFMSIVWFYIVADQVVASLQTLGVIFGINPAILGLTLLAWGNSIADLVADLSLACGGNDGVQIAVTGCYAGPIFNVVVGLGLSLVIACWRSSPEPLFITDDDGSLFFIIGFLAAGLAWALVLVPLKGSKLSKSLGAGLVLLYFMFLVTGVFYVLGCTSRK